MCVCVCVERERERDALLKDEEREEERKVGGGGGEEEGAVRFRCITISDVCFGLALGVGYANIGGILDSDRFKNTYHMSNFSTEILAGIMQLGCIIGSVMASRLADRMGRVVSLKIGT